jgi:hypothetical protein
LVLGQPADREAPSRGPGARLIPPIDRRDATSDQQERAATEEVRAACAGITARGEPLADLPVAARELLVAAVVLARTPAISRNALVRAITRQIDLVRPGSDPAPPVGADSLALAPSVAVDGGGAPSPVSRSSDEPLRRPIVMLPTRDRVAAPVIAERRAPMPPADPPSLAVSPQPRAPATPEAAWTPFTDPIDGPVPAAWSEPRTSFDTAFGGLVFLINAFLAMGLYPDFTRPLDPALPLPPLALADRLGLHWFGVRYRRDPLHRWIAQRGPQPPLPRHWRAEAEWLAPFPGGRAWHDGSTLWHSAGFALANRSAAAAARRLARTLGVRLGSRPPGRSAARAGHDPDWLDCLALFLAARLRRAAPDDALTAATLAIPGRVVIDEARLDVHFALAALPIALRLAGLDRDPGWLPSEGRDLRFHFA